MKLIVGLGNPGAQYTGTRHNAGFLAVDFLAKHFGFDKFKKTDKFKAEIAEGTISGEKVLIAKPQTFMNLSGQTVSGLMNFYKPVLRAYLLRATYSRFGIWLIMLRLMVRRQGKALRNILAGS